MAKKIFTDESLTTFINEIKTHVNNSVSTKANNEHIHEIDDISNLQSTLDNKAAIAELDLLNSAIANKANVADLNSHASDTEIHITNAERNAWNAKSDFSGNYNDLTNKPTIPSIDGLASEDYVDEKVDAITVESIGALPNTTVIPTVPTNISAFTNDAGYLTEHQSLDGLATETYVDTQIDAIDIPSALSDLTTDSTHRVVTDAEKATWNAKSNFSGNYNDLTNKPSIPSISGLATETYVDEAVSTKANSSHTHDNRYYTETEMDTLLAGKANSNHNHNNAYDALGTAETKANAVQANLDVVSEDLTEHMENTDIHFTAAERTKLNGIAANANNYTHPNSGVTAGTYKSVTVNAQGHITSGTNPTTLAGYGITDAETKGAANNALASAKEYADELIADEVADRDSAIATAKSSAISTAASDATTKANNALTSAQTYTDEAIDALSETVSTKADASTLTSHTGNTTIHITGAERTNWNAAKTHADSAHAPTTNATQTASGLMSKADKIKLDGIAEGANNYTLPSAGTSLGGVKSGGDVTISGGVITVNDDSHNHVISNVDGLQSALDSKAASGHNHDDAYYTESEVDTFLSGKANSSHTHTIANITNLQSTLDGKAATSHGTHVSYSTTAPVMDGSASVGTASTVARSDHKHPTDTSRAAQTSLDSHIGNKSNPHGVTLAQLGLTATAAELNALDGITATVTELNYVDGVTSNIQTQLNGKAASSHAHTIANITNLQTTLDGKAASSHTHKVANISDLTATATELNYMDGVTSNVQTQLDGKASSTHNHGLLHTNFTKQIDNTTTDSGWSMINDSYTGFILKSLRTQKDAPTWTIGNYSAGIAFGGADTKGVITHAYNSPQVRFAGGNGTTPVWNFTLKATSGKTYTLPSSDGTIALTSSNITGNAATASAVAWSGVTNKPSYYDAKAIKSITRNGTTFTYTCMDGTTGTFTQQDNNTTYGVATTSANGLMSASDKSKLDGMVLATVSEVKTYLAI